MFNTCTYDILALNHFLTKSKKANSRQKAFQKSLNTRKPINNNALILILHDLRTRTHHIRTSSEIPVSFRPSDDVELVSSVFDITIETCREYVR